MAQNRVEICIPTENTTKISGLCEIAYSEPRLCLYATLSFEGGPDHDTSYFNIPLSLPKNFNIESISCNGEFMGDKESDDGETAGYFVWEEKEYPIRGAGYFDEFVESLNLHKLTHGKYPDEITLKVISGLTHYVNTDIPTIIYPPRIIGTFSGSEEICEPCDTLVMGHKDNHVALLLKDGIISDDEETEISSVSGGKSVVLLDELKKEGKIYQLRFVARLKLVSGDPGVASVEFEITSQDRSIVFRQKQYQLQDGFYFDEAWHDEYYYTFEAVISRDSEFVKEINNYYRSFGKMPEITVSVLTNGRIDDSNPQKNCYSYVSQVYLVAVHDECGINVFEKYNGNYTMATSAYKRQDGKWVEITENECKETLKNNTIRRG